MRVMQRFVCSAQARTLVYLHDVAVPYLFQVTDLPPHSQKEFLVHGDGSFLYHFQRYLYGQ